MLILMIGLDCSQPMPGHEIADGSGAGTAGANLENPGLQASPNFIRFPLEQACEQAWKSCIRCPSGRNHNAVVAMRKEMSSAEPHDLPFATLFMAQPQRTVDRG